MFLYFEDNSLSENMYKGYQNDTESLNIVLHFGKSNTSLHIIKIKFSKIMGFYAHQINVFGNISVSVH